MRNLVLYISLLAAAAFAAPLSAVSPVVVNYRQKDMKANAGTQNWGIAQHNNNFMYFANNSGLLEFDGSRWQRYPIGNYTDVRSIYFDPQTERIYAGAYNEFGYYERDSRGLLKYNSLVNLIDENRRSFSEIWDILAIDNSVYFRGDYALFRYRQGDIKRFDVKNKILCSGIAHDILLVATFQDGVSFLSGDLFIPLPESNILKNKRISAILPFEGEKIMFITDFDGIYLFDGMRTERYATDLDDFMFKNQVFCAAIKDSCLAIGTIRNGLAVKNLKTGETVFANMQSGMQNNSILSLAFDRQGNIWLGLDRGVDYLFYNSPFYDLLPNNMQYGAGYASHIKNSILYLASNQGLYYTGYPLNTSSGAESLRLLGNLLGQVWYLAEIDNTLFCGADHGLYVINGTESRKINGIEGGVWGLRPLETHPGYIIGASYKSFFILKKEGNQWVFRNNLEGMPDTGGGFEEDETGNIWFSHWMKGLFKMSLSADLTTLQAQRFDVGKGLYTERNNTLVKIDGKVVVASDGGFFHYSAPADSMLHYKFLEDLLGIYPYSVRLCQAPYGDIWCISRTGIKVALRDDSNGYRIDTTSFSLLRGKLNLGFEDLCFIDRNRIIVSTKDGFSLLDMKRLENKQEPHFKVSLHSVWLGDSLIAGYTGKEQIKLTFKYSRNSIRFQAAAPEYRNNEDVTYSFFLEGYDDDFPPFSAQSAKEYTQLPSGSYTLHIRAKNSLDASIAETTFEFTVLPPWYKSLPAYAIYVLLAIAAFIYLLYLLKKRSQRALRKLEAQKEQEIKEQQSRFQSSSMEKEKEIQALKTRQLQHDLRHKSNELASSTMNLIRKNEILQELNSGIEKIATELKSSPASNAAILTRLAKMQQEIKLNIERDDNWKKFEENFDLVYENYLRRLAEAYPALTVSDKKLCAYLKMGLSSKDIAPLLNMSFRSVEMSRYRLRKKMALERDVNLVEFLQKF